MSLTTSQGLLFMVEERGSRQENSRRAQGICSRNSRASRRKSSEYHISIPQVTAARGSDMHSGLHQSTRTSQEMICPYYNRVGHPRARCVCPSPFAAALVGASADLLCRGVDCRVVICSSQPPARLRDYPGVANPARLIDYPGSRQPSTLRDYPGSRQPSTLRLSYDRY